ncbi:MFS transporter [Buchnera aphidicola (Mollitrichosiphum nigrofasciatum)]|uniref:MFS transporter n=1 Tax=Buchnera aphidicola TaxID=9 RepID=UPI0031B80727
MNLLNYLFKIFVFFSFIKKKIIKKKYITTGKKSYKFFIISLFCAGLANFSTLYCVQPILPIFSKVFQLNPARSSLSLSITTIVMAIGMLFTGNLADVFGRKRIISYSLFFASFFTILCSSVSNWHSIVICRALVGLSLSGVTSVILTYMTEEIKPSDLALSVGLYISGNTFGGFFGRFFTSFIVHYYSWNIAIFCIGLISFIAFTFFVLYFPSSKNFITESFCLKTFIKNLILPLKNIQLRILFTIGFILMGSFITLFNYVGYRLMIKPFYLNHVIVGFLSVIYLIGVYTSPKAGLLTKIHGYGKVLIGSLILMLCGLSFTQFNQLIIIFLGLILFTGGFFAAHSISSSWIGHCSRNSKGYSSSVYLFFYYLGSSFFGTFGGLFWFFGGWLYISCFIYFLLGLGIFFSAKLINVSQRI